MSTSPFEVGDIVATHPGSRFKYIVAEIREDLGDCWVMLDGLPNPYLASSFCLIQRATIGQRTAAEIVVKTCTCSMPDLLMRGCKEHV